MKDPDRRANRVTVGFRSGQAHANRSVPGGLIVAKQECRPSVGGHQQVDIAVAIEIATGRSSSNFGGGKSLAGGFGDVAKLAAAVIEEEVRRLRVSDVAVNIADRLVDVAVDDDEVLAAVKIEIGEETAEAKSSP